MGPTISVIIPTYNRAKVVGRAVESVCAQTIPAHEIIVIDDGSTDDTGNVLEAFKGRIHCILQENAGVSAARNAGIRAAKGDWIAFLDSDDQWFPDYLETQVKSICQYPDAIVHITNAVTIHSDSREENHFKGTGLLPRFEGRSSLFLKRPLRIIVEHAPWFVQSSVMMRSELTACGLFDPKLTIGEDFDVFSKMSLQGPLCIHNCIRVTIIRNEAELDHLSKQVVRDTVRTIETYAKIIDGLIVRAGLDNIEKEALNMFISSNKRALANLLLAKGEIAQARALYREAFTADNSLRSLGRYMISFLPARTVKLFTRRGMLHKP